MTFVRLLLPAMLLAILSGCALAPGGSPSPDFTAAPSTPETLQRRLTFTPDDENEPSRTLIGIIRLEERQLRAALLTPQGQRLVTLVHDGQASRFEPGDVSREALEEKIPFPPDWLASRLEWSLWPTGALADAFADSPWSVEETRGDRVIRYRGKLMARITPASTSAGREETVLLDDRAGRYRLRIEPIEASSP